MAVRLSVLKQRATVLYISQTKCLKTTENLLKVRHLRFPVLVMLHGELLKR